MGCRARGASEQLATAGTGRVSPPSGSAIDHRVPRLTLKALTHSPQLYSCLPVCMQCCVARSVTGQKPFPHCRHQRSLCSSYTRHMPCDLQPHGYSPSAVCTAEYPASVHACVQPLDCVDTTLCWRWSRGQSICRSPCMYTAAHQCGPAHGKPGGLAT